jgi:hypothetical protein
VGKQRSHRERLTPAVAAEINAYRSWCDRKLLSENFEPSTPLYHYTDLPGFDAILASKSFRLSGLTHLRQSDRGEIQFGIEAARKVLEVHAKAFPNDQPYVETLLGILSWESFTEAFDCYIGCFTRHAEDPEVWRRFGRNDSGVALGIRPQYFKSHPAIPGVVDFILQPVIYGEEEIKARVRKSFDTLVEAGRRGIKLSNKRSDHARLLTEIGLSFLGSSAIPIAVNSKEDSYRVEAEVRGVYLTPAKFRSDGEPRPAFEFVELSPEEITDIYLGRKTDRAEVLEILKRHGISPKLHDAYY